jgi:hypothetical protein
MFLIEIHTFTINQSSVTMRISSILLITITTYLLSLSGCQTVTSPKHGVNPILGDESFVQTFGVLPDESDNEILRIRTHLRYVENLLRQKPVEHLSESLKEARLHMLDLLKIYTAAEEFPGNYDYPDRRIPCFIDRHGNICAVGYLIEQTAGRNVAEVINSEYQYELLMKMDNPTVDEWIAQSGLTKKECAMIQPAYGGGWGYPVQNNTVSPGYAISSSALSGLNFSLTVVNSMQMMNKDQKKIVPFLGLATGASQIALGIGIYPQKYPNRNIISSGDQIFSGINIGLGTATMAISALNLLTNKKPKNKDLSWNVYSFQTPDNQSGVGLSFTKRF